MTKEIMRNLRKLSQTIYSCRRCGMCGNKVKRGVPYICPVRESTPGFDHFIHGERRLSLKDSWKGNLSLPPN